MSVTDINPHSTGNATQIECLACGAMRVVFGVGHGEAGECPRCHYLGWAYSDELDGTTRRLIMNGGFAAAPAPRRHHHPRPYLSRGPFSPGGSTARSGRAGRGRPLS